MKKRIISFFLVFAIIVGAIPLNVINTSAVTFDQLNASNVFLKQEGSTTCTLCATTMMMRRYSMLRGDSDWSSITESSVKSTAWINGTGLKWSFNYSNSFVNSISVGHYTLPGGSANEALLQSELKNSPEGIVIYNTSVPHAVLLTDYSNGVYYCADPLGSISKGRIPLTSSYRVRIDNVTAYWKVTSPTVSGPTTGDHTPGGNIDTKVPVNLGEDFYGVILNYDYWKPITLDYTNDNRVRLRTETGSANQVWRFQRQTDGSYVISSAQTGKVLELELGNHVEDNPVSAPNDFWDGAYQKWYIYENSSGGYLIESYHFTSEGWYLTLDNNNSVDGTAITTCKLTEGPEQVWSIYSKDEVQLKAPVLDIDFDSSTKETVFSWNSVYGAKQYDVKIWEDSVKHAVPAYHIEWNAKSEFSILLPPGEYEAYVVASDYFKYEGSENIKFTVPRTPVNIGEDFYGVIFNYDHWKPITLDYTNDNRVRLGTERGTADQVWRLQRQTDGSYVISSAQTGKVLELELGNRVEDNPVSAPNDFWDGGYQKWYIYENGSGGYLIESYHYTSEGWYLTLDNNSPTDGTAITTCKLTEGPEQVWSIYSKDEVQLKAPVLDIDFDSSTKETVFSWNSVYGAKQYDVKIWENSVDHSVPAYHIEWDAESEFSVLLPPGDYEAYVVASDYFKYEGSENVKFTVERDEYAIIYDANGGTGAPNKQTKAHGVDMTLSSAKPTRTGYTFLGWSTSKTATSATYKAGGSFTGNANITLYAVWEKGCENNNHSYTHKLTPSTCTEKGYTTHTCSLCGDSYTDTYTDIAKHDYTNGNCVHCGATDPNYVIDQNVAQISVESVTASSGQTVRIAVALKNNPGIAGLAVSLKYDESVLSLKATENGGLFSGFTAAKNFAWDECNDIFADGVLATFTFKVAENAQAGDYSIEILLRSCTNENFDDVELFTTSGKVSVRDFVYGDSTGDQKIDMKDVVLLRKYITNFDYDTNTSSVDVEHGADANGDNKIDIKDVVILRKYITNYDFDTESSTVVLGPQ